MAQSQGVTLKATIEAEGREAVREIVASGGGIGFVSAAEFGGHGTLAPIVAEIHVPDLGWAMRVVLGWL